MEYSLLIVDDSVTMRGLIRRVLERTSLSLTKVLEASNGAEGLERMREKRIDLVLADLNMPGMSGEEMIDAMKADDALSHIPVIVVSSEGSQTVLHSLTQKGVKEVIRKPFEPGVLQQTIERVLALPA